MIGILFNSARFSKIMKMRRRSPIVFYQEAADECAVDLCYFCMRHVLKNGNVRAFVYRHEVGLWKEMIVPLPPVTLVRTIITKRKTVKRLEQLEKTYGVHFLNQSTPRRRNKYTNYQRLLTDATIAEHLPYTTVYSTEALFSFLQKYKNVFIKPQVGSLGKKICLIRQKSSDRFIVEGNLTKPYARTSIPRNKLGRYMEQHMSTPRRYIVQQAIEHLTVGGRKFDLRVAVQKNGDGIWQVTGMIARVAQRKHFLTNISQGARAQSITTIPPCQRQDVRKRIEHLCLRIANRIEEDDHSICDLGLDIILSKQHVPFLLEVNYRDQRVTYRDANEWEMWRNTYRNPVQYAQYVQNNQMKNSE